MNAKGRQATQAARKTADARFANVEHPYRNSPMRVTFADGQTQDFDSMDDFVEYVRGCAKPPAVTKVETF